MAIPRPAVGDVFIVPVGDGRAGVGQVIGTYGRHSYYFAIFDAVLPLEVARNRASDALTAPVLLLALSLDAKLHIGHWTVVTRSAVLVHSLLPAYKVMVEVPSHFEVVDFAGRRSRPATSIEAEVLPYRTTVAPVRLEKALRAWLGLEPWLDTFDELRPEGRVTSADIFG